MHFQPYDVYFYVKKTTYFRGLEVQKVLDDSSL